MVAALLSSGMLDLSSWGLGSSGQALPKWWRWVMLLILVYSSTISVLTGQGFSSIAVDAAKYYEVSEVVINSLVTASNAAQIVVALVWTMNMESQYGLQLPYVVGSVLITVGGWLSFYGAQPSHWGLGWVFIGVLLSSAGATFLCTLPVPLSARWFPFEERTFATAIGAMSLVCGIACAYVLQAALHKHIPTFLLFNAVLSTTTLPLAPLFRDPSNRSRALGMDAAERGALLARTAAAAGDAAGEGAGKGGAGAGSAPAAATVAAAAAAAGLPASTSAQALDSVRINTILWLSDWRVALLLLGSTYILGMGFTFLTLIDEVLPADIRDIKTVLAVVFLFSGMTGMVAIGSFVDATKEYIGTLRAVLLTLVVSYLVMAIAWQFSMQAMLYAATSLVAACTFAVMPVALEIAVELTYHSGVELEGAINSWIAVIGSSVWNSITIYAADPNILGVPLQYTGWMWLGYVTVGAAVLVPVEGRLHRTEEEGRRRALEQQGLALEEAEKRQVQEVEGASYGATATKQA